MKKIHHSPQEAFTLIEIMVVISIISLLSVIIFASFGTAKAQARDGRRAEDMVQLRNALTSYQIDHNGVPAAINITGCNRSDNPTVYTCASATSTRTALMPLLTEKYISSIPSDPLGTGGFQYYYSTGPSDNSYVSNGTTIYTSSNGSFDYVNESQTIANHNTPVILGTNIGTPDYSTYPGSGFPSTAGGTGTAGVGTTAPGQSTNLAANVTFGGSMFGFDYDPAALTAAVGQQPTPSAPTSANVSLTWNPPAAGTATSYTVARNGTTIATVSGTSYFDSGRSISSGSATSLQYTVTAMNSNGSASAETVTVNIPPAAVTPSVTIFQPQIAGSPLTAGVTISGSSAPSGTVYKLIYSKNSGVTKAAIGPMTVNNGLAGTTVTDNPATYNLATPTFWEADLSSMPTIYGN